MTIYFVTISLSETVHAGCLGFTKLLHEYAEAPTVDRAAAAAVRWAERQGAKVIKADATEALQQDRRRYVFPEKIIRG